MRRWAKCWVDNSGVHSAIYPFFFHFLCSQCYSHFMLILLNFSFFFGENIPFVLFRLGFHKNSRLNISITFKMWLSLNVSSGMVVLLRFSCCFRLVYSSFLYVLCVLFFSGLLSRVPSMSSHVWCTRCHCMCWWLCSTFGLMKNTNHVVDLKQVAVVDV